MQDGMRALRPGRLSTLHFLCLPEIAPAHLCPAFVRNVLFVLEIPAIFAFYRDTTILSGFNGAVAGMPSKAKHLSSHDIN
ncbi:MAG: hypothetical protein KatS3mg030_267 [Saprospiraceae bacterium]|nr:MAG: hypothetical protein KatS3mg030_267 [Saprospiraceae bacterium]